MYDVIIVGGGPAGSQAAYRLAQAGHRVAVLERQRSAREPVCCTGIISQECVQAFAVDAKTILRRVNSARLFAPAGGELRLEREATQACILDRAAFDISMAERAQEAGAEYVFSCRVGDIAIAGDRVSVASSCRGRETVFEARAAVIASGFGSGLGRRLGLGRVSDFTIGAQAEVAAPGLAEVEVYFGAVAPGFFAWLVPTVPPLARAGLMARKNPARYLRKWLDELASRGKIATSETQISCKGIPLKPPSHTYGERLVMVGDAAGQVKPTSGGGIYYGLLGANIAAMTLHQALDDDDLSAKRLARYERGWRKVLGRELRVGSWARRLFERLSDRQLDRIFEMARGGGIAEALLRSDDLAFDWHSRVLMKLMDYRILSRAIGMTGISFTRRRIDRGDD